MQWFLLFATASTISWCKKVKEQHDGSCQNVSICAGERLTASGCQSHVSPLIAVPAMGQRHLHSLTQGRWSQTARGLFGVCGWILLGS